MNLEGVIVHVNDMGWLIGSLCQLGISDWYVCMIDDAGFAHKATGSTPVEAISTALHNPPAGRVYSPVNGMMEIENEGPIDLFALGLRQRREPLKRRF